MGWNYGGTLYNVSRTGWNEKKWGNKHFKKGGMLSKEEGALKRGVTPL